MDVVVRAMAEADLEEVRRIHVATFDDYDRPRPTTKRRRRYCAPISPR